jgi:alpha-1,2-mannosyltransferase
VSLPFPSPHQPRQPRWTLTALLFIGAAALAAYLVPRLLAARAPWPMWNVDVYWWGGHQALTDASLYAAHEPHNFTYPPFAAALFGLAGGVTEIVLKVTLLGLSLAALTGLVWLSLRQAFRETGPHQRRRRPELTFAATALALLTQPVAYTLHLGEVNLILAVLVAADLLRRHDGAWWQGMPTGLAAGIKLTPLIFVAYLLVTRRFRAAGAATLTFAATIAAGYVLLPTQSRTFWVQGVFLDQHRVGNPFNPANQSLAGLLARLGGGLPAVRPEWLAAALLTGLGGLAVAAILHRRGHRLAGLACCGLTGLLVSPMSWTHHWVWVVPLLITTGATAWHRRSPAWALATAALFAAFSGLDPMPWPGHHPNLLLTLAGNLYVLLGLAVLAGGAYPPRWTNLLAKEGRCLLKAPSSSISMTQKPTCRGSSSGSSTVRRS